MLFGDRDYFVLKGPQMIACDKGYVSYLGHSKALEVTDHEFPATQAVLNYNFSLSKAEITQGEFLEFMGYNPVPEEDRQYGENKPVVYVSWYDAALFCNALSKINELDTVYIYSGVSPEGVLENLETDFSKAGFRLPTEAEWNVAAGASETNIYPWGSDTSLARHFANFFPHSNGKLQDVCTNKSTDHGFCDLAGNALEWTQDWLWKLPGFYVPNFLGGLGEDENTDKVVKGGSFQHGLRQLRNSMRTDNYFSPPYQKTEYIGFRVARGIIEEGSYNSEMGQVVHGISTVKMLPKAQEIRNFFKTRSVKLVAIDALEDKLVRIEFRRHGMFTPLQDSVIIRHPEISPDGRFIAYANRSEGQGGELNVGMITFNSIDTKQARKIEGVGMPRWYMDGHELSLIIVDNIQNNQDSVTWLEHKTVNNAFRHGYFSKITTNPIELNGAYHSGFSSDLNFFASGYTRLRVLDRAKNKLNTYFTYPQNGKDKNASIQVCNVSISKGEKPEIAFIDFGYAQKSSIVGKSYGIHEVIFLMDPATGEINDYIPPPKGYAGWNYPEWSNHPDYLVATAFDKSDANTAVFAIRRSDKQVLQLLSGDEITMPQLWIDPNALDENWEFYWDTAFHYSEPADNINRFYMEQKFLRALENREKVHTLAIGTSRLENAMSVTQMAGTDSGTVINMSFPGGVPSFAAFIMEKYVHPQLFPEVKHLIIDLGLEFFASNAYEEAILFPSLGYQYDTIHQFYAQGISASQDSALQNRINELSTMQIVKDYNLYGDRIDPGYKICHGWGDLLYDIDTDWGADGFWKSNFKLFKQAVQAMEKMDIQVYGVVFPQHPGYAETEYYGRHGGDKDKIAALVDSLNTLVESTSNFQWKDLNKNGKHKYSEKYFADADHLCFTGAMAITDEIQDWIEKSK